MKLGSIVNKSGENITEKVINGEYTLSREASECVEKILSGVRGTEGDCINSPGYANRRIP
ncbi:MAG: hypothetical protein Q4C14_01890 [Bacillota bacterium]|nr:hypothetical protein [Bacillota bacterium]